MKSSSIPALALAVVVALSCRSSGSHDRGQPVVDPVAAADDEGELAGELVGELGEVIIVPTPSEDRDPPRFEQTKAATTPTEPEPERGSGLLCCFKDTCVVPGPADCHYQIVLCDSYTLKRDPASNIIVARCES